MVEGHVPARACWFDSSPGQFGWWARRRRIRGYGALPNPQGAALTGQALWPAGPVDGRVAGLLDMPQVSMPLLPTIRRIFLAAMLSALLLNLSACTPQPVERIRSEKTQSDLLRAAYPDLASGRFAVVADFEDASHRQLFHLAGPTSPQDVLTLSTTAGREQTGAGALLVRFAAPDTQLVANNDAARAWLLKRDWRAYNLLLMSVHSPVDDLTLDFAIVGGEEPLTQQARSRLRLRAGWNLLRLDLDEAGDYLALDDVHELRWSVPDAQMPIELHLDDLVLTDSRTSLHGSPDGPPGALYAEQAGRRLVVGAAQRFALSFANGQIVRWFDLRNDPARLNDLVGPGNTLGPVPVVAPADRKWVSDQALRWPGGLNPQENALVTRQRLVEANAVRVVIEAEWSLADTGGAAPSDSPVARWRYVIYPSGQIYTSVLSPPAEASAEGHLGLLVSGKPRPELIVDVHEPGGLGDRPDITELSYASLATADGAGLLFVVHDSWPMSNLRVVRAPDRPRVSVVAFADEPAPAGQWLHVLLSLRSGPPSASTAAEARSYCAPASPEFLVGGLARGAAGDADGDGFDERSGTFLLEPDGNRVQLRLDGARGPIVSPAFCVLGSAGREAWVYVDYVVQEAVARDADGRLIFQLPGEIEGVRLVEVYLRNPADSPSAQRF